MKTINKKGFLRISKCSSRFQSHKDLGTGMYLKQNLEEVVIVYQEPIVKLKTDRLTFLLWTLCL